MGSAATEQLVALCLCVSNLWRLSKVISIGGVEHRFYLGKHVWGNGCLQACSSADADHLIPRRLHYANQRCQMLTHADMLDNYKTTAIVIPHRPANPLPGPQPNYPLPSACPEHGNIPPSPPESTDALTHSFLDNARESVRDTANGANATGGAAGAGEQALEGVGDAAEAGRVGRVAGEALELSCQVVQAGGALDEIGEGVEPGLGWVGWVSKGSQKVMFPCHLGVCITHWRALISGVSSLPIWTVAFSGEAAARAMRAEVMKVLNNMLDGWWVVVGMRW